MFRSATDTGAPSLAGRNGGKSGSAKDTSWQISVQRTVAMNDSTWITLVPNSGVLDSVSLEFSDPNGGYLSGSWQIRAVDSSWSQSGSFASTDSVAVGVVSLPARPFQMKVQFGIPSIQVEWNVLMPDDPIPAAVLPTTTSSQP